MSKLFIALILFFNVAYAASLPLPAITETISTNQLQGYENYSAVSQHLIEQALKLTQQHLTYQYGSANPENGGMDCSGTIYYLLKKVGVKAVPRQADQMYEWVLQNGKIYAKGSDDFNANDFTQIKPGDLLFWSGTYQVTRKYAVTHVMLYLGKNQQGQLLMFGASDGRSYQGKPMRGVSVFDFKLPNKKAISRFEGFSCIPDLTC